jgi:V8-like Glu-specific endopeptidase
MALFWQNILGGTNYCNNFWAKTSQVSSPNGRKDLLGKGSNNMMMIPKQQIWIGLLLLINSIGDCWLATSARSAIFDRAGNKMPDREVNSDRVNWKMLPSATGKQYNAVGSLDVNYGVCTAFSIEVGNHPEAPAYIVTNGHCQGTAYGLPAPNDILVNKPSRSHFVINYFHDYKSQRLRIPVKRMVYGTMKNNDIAILELTKTQKELKGMGINSLKISTKVPKKGRELLVVGIPSEGVKNSLKFLHTVSCKVGETVHLKEDVYSWTRSLRHNCSIVGGMSGSPMISAKTNRVVGIINTGVNDDAAKQPECSLNRPCEVSPTGKINTFNRENYGQLVDRIPTCFDKRGIFDLQQSSCKLERP